MHAQLNDPRIPEKYWAKVTVNESGCWAWGGSIMTNLGYSRLTIGGERVLGHRYFYKTLVGEIPEGLVLDHICHNKDLTCDRKTACPHRACVNPDHLEPVTNAANLLRSTQTLVNKNATKEYCLQGHPFDEPNTRVVVTKTGLGRVCRKCQAEHAARRAAKDRSAHLKKGRDYYAENRERLLAAKREYRAKKQAARAPLSRPVN